MDRSLLSDEVEHAVEIVREWTAGILAEKKNLETPEGCKAFLRKVEGSLAFISADLRRRYGFALASREFEDPSRPMPRTHLKDWLLKLGLALPLERALQMAERVRTSPETRALFPRLEMPAAVGACLILEDPDALPRWWVELKKYPDDEVKEMAVLCLGGAAVAHTSLASNKDLAQAVRLSSEEPFEGLCDMIPAAIVEAMASWDPTGPVVEGPGSLVNVARNKLSAMRVKKDGEKRGKTMYEEPLPEDSDVQPAAEGETADSFVNREEEREMLAKALASDIFTPAEREVMELVRQGLTQEQIAGRQGVKRGTVGVLASRAMKKLRLAMGQG